jgi:hypothetical protein
MEQPKFFFFIFKNVPVKRRCGLTKESMFVLITLKSDTRSGYEVPGMILLQVS